MTEYATLWIAALYVLVSPLRNAVIAQSGACAVLYLLFGAAVVAVMRRCLRRGSRYPLLFPLFCSSFLLYLLLSTTETVNAYLYHNRAFVLLTVMISLFAGVGLFTRGKVVGYLSRVFLGGAVFSYFLIVFGSMRRLSADGLFPLKISLSTQILNNLLMSVVVFLPLLLPETERHAPQKRWPFLAAEGAVVLLTGAEFFLYPYDLLKEQKNMFIEISKNMSFGRFFQRMEVVGSLLFLMLSLLMITQCASCLTSSVGNRIQTKSTRNLIVASLFIACVILAFFNRDVAVLSTLSKYVMLFTAVLSAVVCLPRTRQVAMVALVGVMTGLLTSCVSYREIDTYDYPIYVAVEATENGTAYFFRTEEASFHAVADSLNAAKDAINQQRPKPLDLSQLSMVFFSENSSSVVNDVLKEIQQTDVHNSVFTAIVSESAAAVAEVDFADYHGIGEYVDELKTLTEKYKALQTTAFDAYTKMTRDGACFLPWLTVQKDSLQMSGGIAVGRERCQSVSSQELTLLEQMRMQKPSVSFCEGEMMVSVSADAQDVTWVEEIYRQTGCDILGVYAKIARQYRSEEEYRKILSAVKIIAVRHR